MRLTLRNILAYLDKLLDETQTRDLEQKLAESQIGQEQLQRIQEVTRRLRLPAPAIEGRGLGLDPNTVAEYLDHSLPSERVADFEKVCLESDMHLAEVASCHQILARVLREPAEVPVSCKPRMYGVVNAASQPAINEREAVREAVAVAAAAVATPAEAAKPQSAVPSYLREETPAGDAAPATGGSRFPWALAAVLLVALGLAALLGTTPGRQWLADLGLPDTLGPRGTGGPPPAGTAPAATGNGTSPGTPSATGTAAPGVSSTAAAAPSATLEMPANRPDASTGVTPAPAGTAPAGATGSAPLPLPPEPSAAPPSGTAMPAPTALPDSTAAPTGTASPSGTAAPPAGTVAMSTGGPTPTAAAPTGTAAAAATGTAAAPPRIEVGRVTSELEVVLAWDARANQWRRAAARSTLVAGDRLLCLPGFRAQLGLTSGVTVELREGAMVELLAPEGRGAPGLRVLNGRLLAFTVAGANTQMRLMLEGHDGVVTFGQADAEVAVDVRRARNPGNDPEATPGPVVGDLYVTKGDVLWTEAAGPQAEPLKAPAVKGLGAVVVTADATAAPAPQLLPEWITPEVRSQVDQRGTALVEEGLRGERPVTLVLRELADDRRSEVSLAALRCQLALDEFDDTFKRLRDPAARASWTVLVDAVVAALDRGPEPASRIREVCVKQHGDQGLRLYRMLWGYSDDDLRNGGGAELVAMLDDPELDFRVVAIWNLRQITGGQTFFYQPHDNEAKRRQSVTRWKQLLDSGKLLRKPA